MKSGRISWELSHAPVLSVVWCKVVIKLLRRSFSHPTKSIVFSFIKSSVLGHANGVDQWLILCFQPTRALLSLPNRKQGKPWLRVTMAMRQKNVRFSWTEQKEAQITALWKKHERLYDVSSALKNAAVAKSCLSVDFIVKNFHQIFSLWVKTLSRLRGCQDFLKLSSVWEA